MNIYDQEAPTGVFLNVKKAPSSSVNIRLFGEPIMYDKDTEFNGKKERKTKFATLCLYRNPSTKESEIKVYEFGWTVQKQLRQLKNDEDWGNPNEGGYDITVKSEGEGLQTEYFVTPRPKKELTQAELALIDGNDIDLRKAVKADESDDSYNPYQDS